MSGIVRRLVIGTEIVKLFLSLSLSHTHTQAPKPAPYVKEMHDQALFYGNRIIRDFKGKDE